MFLTSAFPFDYLINTKTSNPEPSLRSQIITRRTYNRPLDDDGQVFETWKDTINRVISHQQWLWERAQRKPLSYSQLSELTRLGELIIDRKCCVSGRTLWLGGTEVAKKRESSQFSCSFLRVESVYDIVDVLWLLLQGCGVGFKPVAGVLNGFTKRIDNIEIIRSTRTYKGGNDKNCETWLPESKTWIIQIGDSAEAWAKAIGKLVAGKYPADKLIIDLSQIRPAGQRLRGYGWISSGDEQLAKAMQGVCKVMNNRASQLLSVIDILDIVNWLGTVLSSRRSAEIALLDYNHPERDQFITAKKNHFETGNAQRAQSNNSVMFWEQPSKSDLHDIFQMMVDSGGSEPGFINAAQATNRGSYFAGFNPCGEIILGNKSFCNLATINLPRFNNDYYDIELSETLRLLARANYRQTCVNLDDGVLQRSWHELNEFLHLTGIGVSGVVRWDGKDSPNRWQYLRKLAHEGANSMADELGMPRSKNITTLKPDGTCGKLMDTTEGIHKPLGRYIFNNINFNKHDPLVKKLLDHGYRVFENPYDSTGLIVTFPVEWDDVEFDKVGNKHVNTDSAVSQLERYKMVMDNYIDHNCSITVSYDPSEVKDIVNWIHKNWDTYVATSFLFRTDPTKTAKDLGFPYLPQEVVTEKQFKMYSQGLKPFSLDQDANSLDMIDTGECANGVCPVR